MVFPAANYIKLTISQHGYFPLASRTCFPNFFRKGFHFGNNVQLVDIFLGDIIRTLKEEGIWDTSTLVIGTDHRWRSPAEGMPLKNIPLLVKLPGQTQGHQYHEEVEPIEIKAMLEQIAIKKNHTPEGLISWLDSW